MLMMTGLLPLKFWVTDPANLFPSRSQRDTWKQGRWKQREKQGQHEQRHGMKGYDDSQRLYLNSVSEFLTQNLED